MTTGSTEGWRLDGVAVEQATEASDEGGVDCCCNATEDMILGNEAVEGDANIILFAIEEVDQRTLCPPLRNIFGDGNMCFLPIKI